MTKHSDGAKSPYYSTITGKWFYFTPEDGEVGPFDCMEDAVNHWANYQISLEV